MISQDTIQQILNRIDILDVVGEFVKLKKRGANYLGLCPFHNEKTPSFTVSPSKEIYKCFGCGKSGNTISFVMEHEKYSYVDALKWLASRYGVEIEETFVNEEQKQLYQVADSLYIINTFAQEFFSKTLFDSGEGRDVGLSYFKERGFREAIIKKFQLGYSPEQRDAFTKEALVRQYNPELLIKSGLVANRNDQLTDNYRGRVIFPVHNASGRVLGFGARILKTTDKAPKYINTPENEIYVKSKILYGSYFARTAIDKADECLLVEGYTDVVSLHQAGIENVVASGGTSLTQDQIRLVKKYTRNLTIIYDGDAAGVKAALRGLDLALEEGLNVKLVLIPDKEDPDSYVNKVGAAAFTEFIKQNKKDFILFQLEVSLQEAGNDSAKKAALVNQMAETISKINKAEDFTRQQDYIRQSASLLSIDEAGLHSLVNQYIRNRINQLEKKFSPDRSREDEAKDLEENARQAEAAGYDDVTFTLLHKNDLQEKEIARLLLEYGPRAWQGGLTVASFILSKLDEGEPMENDEVQLIVDQYKIRNENGSPVPDKIFFIYNPNAKLSAFAVSLLNFPYEESEHWKSEMGQSAGYQQDLFQLSYEKFLETLAEGNEGKLAGYLKSEEDKTGFEIESAINYLQLRKTKKMLLQNQADMDKATSPQEIMTLQQTHDYLKNLEISLSEKIGTVIIR